MKAPRQGDRLIIELRRKPELGSPEDCQRLTLFLTLDGRKARGAKIENWSSWAPMFKRVRAGFWDKR